jgi:peptidyl-prolyl cis-trans isomerase SurA
MKLNMNIIKKTIIAVCISLISLVSITNAQVKQGATLEKIMAVVGNDIITLSDVYGYLEQMKIQDSKVNPDDPDMQKKVLDMMINEKLVIAKAIEDSVTVSDEEVDQRWEYQLQRFVMKYGSEKRIEDIFGISIQQMRLEFREDIRKQMLSERIKQKNFSDISVTRAEVSDFYDKYKDSLQVLPAQIELFHIVKNVESDKQSKADIIKLAKSIRDSLVNGGDFADFAKRYSGDPGTATSGGDLGWATKGKFIKEFEQAAFAQQKGAISMPVETPFGFHIIQTLDKNKDSIKTRHILLKLGQNLDDIEKTKKTLSNIKAKIDSGTSFEEMAKISSDETETRGFGGSIGAIYVSQIPAALKETIDKLKDGEVSEPLVFNTEPKRTFHIVYKKRTIPEHLPTLKNDYTQIETFAKEFKRNELYNQWVEKLRKEMYWEKK